MFSIFPVIHSVPSCLWVTVLYYGYKNTHNGRSVNGRINYSSIRSCYNVFSALFLQEFGARIFLLFYELPSVLVKYSGTISRWIENLVFSANSYLWGQKMSQIHAFPNVFAQKWTQQMIPKFVFADSTLCADISVTFTANLTCDITWRKATSVSGWKLNWVPERII